MRSLKEAIAERNEAFENDDLNWARIRLSHHSPSSDLVVEAAFHKARYECTAVSTKKRLESQAWLASRGVRSMSTGELVTVGEHLPV